MQFNQIMTPEELYEFMKRNIFYGFVSNFDGKIYTPNNNLMYSRILIESYYLQTPQEVLKTKYGLCFDQVELARWWFLSHGYNVYTFFIKDHNHTVLIYESDNKFYLFERAFKPMNGIHKFISLEDALIYIYQEEAKFNNKKMSEIKIYRYNEVLFGTDFYDYCLQIISQTDQELHFNK